MVDVLSVLVMRPLPLYDMALDSINLIYAMKCCDIYLLCDGLTCTAPDKGIYIKLGFVKEALHHFF